MSTPTRVLSLHSTSHWRHCLAAVVCALSTQANAQCVLKDKLDLHLDFSNGDPRVAVSINGKQGSLVFSNRSNVSSLFNYSLKQLSLHPVETPFVTINKGKEEPVYRVRVGDLKIGGQSSADQYFFVVTTEKPWSSDEWGVLSTADYPGDAIEYDYPDNFVRIYSEKSCEGRLKPPWDDKAIPVSVQKADLATFMGEVNGLPIAMQINSSQTISTINTAGVKLLNLQSRSDPKQTVKSADAAGIAVEDWDDYSDQVVTLGTVKVSSEVLKDIDIRLSSRKIAPAAAADSLGSSRNYYPGISPPPMITLGIDFLRTHHILISPTQRLAFITPTGKGPIQKKIYLKADDAVGKEIGEAASPSEARH